MILGMPDLNQAQDRKGLLTIALDHAWRWYDFRWGQAIQIINFFVLAAAVMSAAYVSAINANHRGIAAAVALLGSVASASTYVVSIRIVNFAELASEPLKEIQDQLATALDIDSIRLIERRRSHRGGRASSSTVAKAMFAIAISVCFAAAGYAWIGR